MTTGRDPKPHPRVSRFYRWWTFAFFGVSTIVAGLIAFVAFSSASITITLGTHEIRQTTTVTVRETSDVGGQVLLGKLLFEKTDSHTVVNVPASGDTVEDYARGKVTIVNRWTKTQPLAATTRLRASSSGLIYRTTERVNVPAGGQATVEVVADDQGERGNIPPDQFEIVALWQGLKDKIYGESTEPMTGGLRSQSTVTQVAIDGAVKELEHELLAKAAASSEAPPSEMSFVDEPSIVESAVASDVKAGAEVPSFAVRGTVRTIRVAVGTSALNAIVANALGNVLPADEEFTSDSAKIIADVLTIDEREKSAQLELTMSNTARIRRTSEKFRPENFTRKTVQEIIEPLRGTAGVLDVHVKLSPFWATRSPSLPSQIRVYLATKEG